MNILFVAGAYFPNANANTACMEALIDAAKMNGHNVSVLIPQLNLNEKSNEQIHGNNIYRIHSNSDYFYWVQDECTKLDLPLNMHSVFCFANKLFQIFNKIVNILNRANFLEAIACEKNITMGKKIANICNESDIDLVISVSVPYSSHIAVSEAMNMLPKKPKWIVYMLDPHGASPWINPKGNGKLFDEEIKVFSLCDQVIMMDVLQEDYMKPQYDSFREKFRYLKPPLFSLNNHIVENGKDGIKKESGELTVLFAGTLYDNCRDYQYVFKMFENIARTMNVCIHIMGNIYPQSRKKLQTIVKRNPDRITIYGRMPYEFARSSMCKADVLVNIGNDYTDIIPSKIFEYMAARRPILNFFRIDNDTALPYLTRYPICLNIDERKDFQLSTAEIRKFFVKIQAGVEITEKEIRKIFYEDLTEQVQRDFMKYVDECMIDYREA